MMRISPIGLIAILTVTLRAAGFPAPPRVWSAGLDLVQFRDQMNLGLVYTGPQLHAAMDQTWKVGNGHVCFSPMTGFGITTTRGMLGLNIPFRPVQLDYLRPGPVKYLQAGPFYTMEYNYQLYPHLQSGYSFWLTNFSLGITGRWSRMVKGCRLRVRGRAALLNLVSRQETDRSPYYFDLSARDIVSYLHQNLRFATITTFNLLSLQIRVKRKEPRRSGMTYALVFRGYHRRPRLAMLQHTLTWDIYGKTGETQP